MTAALGKIGWKSLVSALKRPTRSLASRIAISVLGAVLATGVAVTWISSQSTETFLRAKIDQKFPEILRGTTERLELWYSQREVDVATFAHSETVVDSLAVRGGGREELARYLSYVLDQFPQYETLFVLAPDGRVLLDVGAELDLPTAYRERLAQVRGTRIDPLHQIAGRSVQVVSAGVNEAASLHAVLRGSAVAEALHSDDLGPQGGVYVVDGTGAVIFRSDGAPARERYDQEFLASAGNAEVSNYRDGSGADVVGSSLAFSRFGWQLVVEEPYAEAFAPVVQMSRKLLVINLGITLVFVLIAYQVSRSIVRPVLALSEGAQRIANGEVDVEIEAQTSNDEIGVMLRAFNDMTQRLRENQTELEGSRREVEDANSRLIAQNRELQRVNEVFQQLSITDELTKLHNHRFFQEHLPREIKRAARTGESLCLILIDIDDFKALNDRFGHSVGDSVLRKVAAVMNESVRDMDLLARYGGEEFVLLAARTELEGAVALAEKIRVAIGNARFNVPEIDGPEGIRVTASFGVARYRGDDKGFFNDADRALYTAKGSGKDCVVVADED